MEARKQPAPGGLAIATFGFNCHLNVGDGLAAREQIAHPAERFEHFVLGVSACSGGFGFSCRISILLPSGHAGTVRSGDRYRRSLLGAPETVQHTTSAPTRFRRVTSRADTHRTAFAKRGSLRREICCSITSRTMSRNTRGGSASSSTLSPTNHSSPRPTPWRRLVTAMDALGDNS